MTHGPEPSRPRRSWSHRSVLDWLIEGDRWIPSLIVFAFVLLTILFAQFVMLAVETFPGLVTDPAPRHAGPMSAEERTERTGWHTRVEYGGEAGLELPLLVVLTDVHGRHITDATVSVLAERLNTRHAQAIPVQLGETAPGHYTAHLALPLGGEWTLRVTATKGDGFLQNISTVKLAPRQTP